MTLIAGFSQGGCPILMGDLLVSSSDSTDREITFPTVGKISNCYLSNGRSRPIGFCQKVNLLSPKLAVVWAGGKKEAKKFMLEVMAGNLHNNPEKDSLRDVFDNIGGNLSVIGIYRNGREMSLFGFEALPVTPLPAGFEWFKGEGTGYEALLEIAPQLHQSRIRVGNPNKLERGMSTAVNLSGGLLSREIQTVITLRDLYGAGYEIVHPLGSGLVKFCDLTYLFWRAKEKTKGKWHVLPFPFLACNYSYHVDILVIRSARIKPDSSRECYKIDSDDLHMIEPVYRPIHKEEFVGYAAASFNTKWICDVFCCEDYLGKICAFASHSHYVTKPPPVIWRDEFSDNARIDIDVQFVKDAAFAIPL